MQKNQIQLNNKNRCVPVICINTSEIFKSTKEASIKYNINGGNISNCCIEKNKAKSAGVHPITGEKLVWMYYKEYLKLKNTTII